MEFVLDYFEAHYILMIFLSLVLIFAFVGYFVRKKQTANQQYKLADENAKAEQELENLAKTVSKTASLQDFMHHTATYQQPAQAASPQPAAQAVQPAPQAAPQTVATPAPQAAVAQPAPAPQTTQAVAATPSPQATVVEQPQQL